MPTHGDEATREAVMAAFAKSWRRKLNPTDVRFRGELSGHRSADGGRRRAAVPIATPLT
jgi:hypothetical protein